MKKIVLTLVAMMAFTLTFAETKNTERFDMSVNMHRLAVLLDLNEWQMEAVEAIHNSFNDEVQGLSSVRGPKCRHMVHEAVRKNFSQMHRVLNDKQLNTYMLLIGTTLRNRHL